MRIGYFRSEGSQAEIDRAIAALESAGSDRVMFDSTPRSRPESGAAFLAFLARLNPGDTLVVTDLGQVAQTTELLVERLADLIERGVKIETLSSEIDTADPATGRCIMALRSFALRNGRARAAGHARNGAVSPGRPRRLSAEEVAAARAMIDTERRRAAEVAQSFGVSRATLYRALRR